MPDAWVYMLRCRDGSLYTGWTNDVQRRLERHRAGRASRYTASRLPVELALALAMPDRAAAMRAEAKIKRLRRPEKLALIRAGDRGALPQADEAGSSSIGHSADRKHMQSNITPTTQDESPRKDAGAPVMERDEMRRALERVSREMLQRVADSFEIAPPAAARD